MTRSPPNPNSNPNWKVTSDESNTAMVPAADPEPDELCEAHPAFEGSTKPAELAPANVVGKPSTGTENEAAVITSPVQITESNTDDATTTSRRASKETIPKLALSELNAERTAPVEPASPNIGQGKSKLDTTVVGRASQDAAKVAGDGHEVEGEAFENDREYNEDADKQYEEECDKDDGMKKESSSPPVPSIDEATSPLQHLTSANKTKVRKDEYEKRFEGICPMKTKCCCCLRRCFAIVRVFFSSLIVLAVSWEVSSIQSTGARKTAISSPH